MTTIIKDNLLYINKLKKNKSQFCNINNYYYLNIRLY